jgi:FkbH-like protein
MIETLPETLAPPETPAEAILPPEALAAFAAFRGALAARSEIVWGEHCSECAYPACYSTCAFYTPRSDMNCRRFETGFEPVSAAPGVHRVRFRKWGKLEGRGPAPVLPIAAAERLEAKDARAARRIAAAPLPYAFKRHLAWSWNGRKAGIAPRAAAPADAFVVETWARRPEPFTLTILNDADPGGRLFQTQIAAGPGYRLETIPVARIAAQVDLDAPYLVQIEPVGNAEGVEAVFGVCDFVALKTAPPAAALSTDRPAKVVVWDLDETLWTGTLAEDGIAGVTPRPEAVEAIRMLDERGVLQSIASKNDAAEAREALEAFGLADYFLHPQAHWSPKSGSVAAIARALDLSLDSLVLIDDQPFERAEVQTAHPMVRTLPHTAVCALAAHPWFYLPVTTESRNRRHFYRQESQRTAAYERAGGDYLVFLQASDITLTIAPLESADVERVYELSQRTNQLNFNGARFSRAEVEALVGDPARAAFVLRCADRFGDYGLIGFAVTELGAGRLSDFFMSCRVQRKRVEHAAFAWLSARMADAGADDMRAAFTPQPRNGAAKALLDDLGFAPLQGGERRRALSAPIPEADVVRVLAPVVSRRRAEATL